VRLRNEKPTFISQGTTRFDLNQGELGWFIAVSGASCLFSYVAALITLAESRGMWHYEYYTPNV